jgi:hypothetical protein
MESDMPAAPKPTAAATGKKDGGKAHRRTLRKGDVESMVSQVAGLKVTSEGGVTLSGIMLECITAYFTSSDQDADRKARCVKKMEMVISLWRRFIDDQSTACDAFESEILALT